jgi:hypothetical protein
MTDTTRVEVEFGARTGELDAGAKKASSAVKQFATDVQQAAEGSRSGIGLIGPLFAGIGDAGTKAAGVIRSAFVPLSGMFAGVAAAIGGGALVGALREVIDTQDEISKGAQKVGITTEALSELAYAGKLADVEMGELQRTLGRLSVSLVNAQAGQKEAVELFRRLKIDPDNLKDADDLLMSLAERFKAMEDGAKKTALAAEIFGERVGPRMVPFLNQGRDGIEELREEARKLGVTISTEAGKQAEDFNDNLTRLQSATKGAWQALAGQLLPTLTAITDALAETNREGSILKDAFSGLGSVGKVVFETVAVLAANVAFVFKGVGREIGAMAAQIAALARLDISGFRAISEFVKADAARARQELDDLERRILGLGKGNGADDPRELARRGRNVAAYGSTNVPEAPSPTAGKKADKAEKPARTFVGPAEGSVADYERILDIKRAAYAEENGLREMSKQAELAYWQEVLAQAGINEAGRSAIALRVRKLEIEAARDAAQQQAEIGAIRSENAKAADLDRIAQLQAISRQELDQGLITKQQYLDQERQFIAQRLALELDYVQQKIAVAQLDPDRNLVLLEQLEAQKAEIRRKYAAETASSLADTAKAAAGPMQTIFASLESGFVQVAQSAVTNWRGIGQTISGVMKSITSTIVGELAKQAIAQVAAYAKKRGLTLSGILGDAAEAAAGAAKSVASIPYIGPILAVAAMGTILAAVGGLTSKVPSAAGGFDIPAGLNPMTQLHEEEMVLPAELSNGIRSMVSGSAGGTAINLPTGMRAEDFYITTGRELMKAISGMRRDFSV